MCKKVGKLITIFVVGGIVYGMMEILNRGFTHITMGLLGGICFIVMHMLNGERMKGKINLLATLFVSAVFITATEFISGEILNNLLKMDIWTYRDLPFNLDGQICLLFSIIWFFVSVFGIVADNFVRKHIFKEILQKCVEIKMLKLQHRRTKMSAFYFWLFDY